MWPSRWVVRKGTRAQYGTEAREGSAAWNQVNITSDNSFRKNGGNDETRARDLCRDITAFDIDIQPG